MSGIARIPDNPEKVEPPSEVEYIVLHHRHLPEIYHARRAIAQCLAIADARAALLA